MRDIIPSDGHGIERQRLRLAEIAGHVGSWLAVATTLIMVGAAAAREVNPVSAFVIEHAGLATWAAGTPLLVAAIFGALRVADDRDQTHGDRVQYWHLGALVSSALVLDGLANVYAIATAGLPETLRWAVLVQEAGAVALLALVLVVRPDPRFVLDELTSTVRGVTVRLSGVERQQMAALAVGGMLVLSSLGGVAGPLSSTDKAAAAGTVIEDFEDGEYTDTFTSDTNLEVVSGAAFEGDFGLRSKNGANADASIASDPDSVSWYYRPSAVPSNGAGVILESDGGTVISISHKDGSGSGNLEYYAGTNGVLNAVELDTWYRIKVTNITTDTVDLRVIDQSTGDVVGSADDVSRSNTQSINTLSLSTSDAPDSLDYDYFARDGAEIGQKVSGNVTNSDGGGISDADLTLKNTTTGNTVATTTSSADGSYQFDAVSSGSSYQITASDSGYQDKSSDTFSVTDSPRTVDLKLFQSGTFVREFQLDEDAQQTYPPSMSRLEVYRFDRAIEFPLPGGTTFKAGPGDWNEIADKDINAYGKASVRLEDGTPYRVEVIAESGDRSTRWGSLGWRANKSAPDPYLITVGDQGGTATPTGTATGTATSPTATPIATDGGTAGGGVSGPEYPGLNPPCDPFDRDNDGNLQECPDGDGTDGPGPTVTYTESDGFGPRIAGECVLTDGTTGLLIEYWDPSYETTSLTFNVSHGNSSYAGDRQFDTAAGYATWCVADAVTGNASDAADGALSGNYTQNGTTFNYTEDLQQSALLGGPLGGGGGGGGPGDASTGQQVVGIGLSAGVAYLLARRFTDFRISSALSSAVSRARSLVGGGS